MSSIARQSYWEFEAFERALRGVQGHYLLTKPTIRQWRLCLVDLDQIAVMLAQEGAPNLYQGACTDDFFRILIPLTRSDRLAVNGDLLDRTSVAWFAPTSELRIRAYEATRWLAVSIHREQTARWLEQHSVDPLLSTRDVAFRADAVSIHRILELMHRILRVDAADRGALDSRPTREALSEELIGAVLSIVAAHPSATRVVRGRPRLSRHEILKRVAGLIDERFDQPILIGDFCRAARVSSRTLHAVFIEQFGMSPHRYLMLLRLRAIHSALLRAEPTETVTAICGRFGVWDYGRFARHYRRYFGRSPSQAFRGHGVRAAATNRVVSNHVGQEPAVGPVVQTVATSVMHDDGPGAFRLRTWPDGCGASR